MSSDRIIALTLALCLLSVAVLVRRRAGAIAVVAHNVAWAVGLVSFGLPLINFTDVSGRAWLLLTVAMVAFNVGALSTLSIAERKPRLMAVRQAGPLVRRAVPACYVVGAILFLRAIFSTFGSRLFTDPIGVRSGWSDSTFTEAFSLPARVLFSLGPLTFVCLAFPQISGVRWGKRVRIVLMGGMVTIFVASLGRSYVFVALIWALTLMFMAPDLRPELTERLRRFSRRAKRRRLRALVLTGLLAFFSFQLLANALGKTASQDGRIVPYVNEPLRGSEFTSLVLYASGSIAAWGQMVDGGPMVYPNGEVFTQTEPYYGGAIGVQALGPLGFNTVDEVRPFAAIPFPFNTYTWLDAWWLDFREVGVVLIPMLLGIGITFAAARQPRSAEGLLATSLLVSALMFTPFTNRFADTYVWSSLAALAISHLLRRRTPHGRLPVPGTISVAAHSGPRS